MGVQNLWMLLAPVGRQIELESLAGEILAVDASIWLTQFVKAMRDDEGNMIRNAHLIGTFHRVAKLLYYGVRPVFVFDGQTPEIKKRTTSRRRKRQETQTENLRQTAQRLLLNKIKQQRQEMKHTNDGVNAAVASGFTLPETTRNHKKHEEKEAKKTGTLDERHEKKETAVENEDEENGMQMTVKAEDEHEELKQDLTLDDIDLDTTRLSKIDLHAVFSLPSHLQKDMVQKILRDRRQMVRDQFIPLAGNPEKYSHTQISSFLQTSALNRRIEAVKRKKRREEMTHQGGIEQGHRIDSNSNRFYIYHKDSDSNNDEDDENVVVGVDRTDMAEQVSATKPLQSSDAQGDAFQLAEKQTLSEISSMKPGLVSNANVTEAAAAWIARHQIRVRQEPMLAIEQLRLDRLKKTERGVSVEPGATNVSVKMGPASDLSVLLKVDDVEPEEMARFQKQFSAVMPASATRANVNIDDDDDDVDWEEVDAPTTKQPSPDTFSSENGEQKVSKHVVRIESSPLAKTSEQAASKERMSEEGESENKLKAGSSAFSLFSLSVGVTDAVSREQLPGQKKQQLPDIDFRDEQQTAYEVDDTENTEDLFMTLKDEMEEAKGHEDLDLLRHEALQSAMATASNLTQWAAGAVRRALQAHSLQHGRNVEALGSSVAAARKSLEAEGVCALGAAKDVPQLVSKETESKPVIHDTHSTEVVATKEEKDVTEAGMRAINAIHDDEEQLQVAIAASIASDREMVADKSDTARVRYLQYSSPSEPSEPILPMDTTSAEMDAAALQKEQLELKKLRSRQLRDTEGITDEMVAEVMELLRLFGVPFLVSPMEAEAQCAALEQLGLVDGVVTDDSDIFPFGGQHVYKNIFHHQKFVEAFSACDIERELGFSREQLIALALLLGSDYTDGVRGIGIVNATEIAASYPGIEGLREFKKWVREFDVTEEAQRIALNGSKKKANTRRDHEKGAKNHDETIRECFQRSHANARRKWELGDEFPSQHVIQAYMAPQVDRSDARFSWSSPDLVALRSYCANAFGWDEQKSDGILRPLEDKAKAAVASGHRHIQTRLDRFFTSYNDQVHYAQIQSKRLRSAVNLGTSSKRKKQRK